MSRNLAWKPVVRVESNYLNATPHQMDALKEIFSDMVLDRSSLPLLHAMSIASGKDLLYIEISEIIEKHGEIKLIEEF